MFDPPSRSRSGRSRLARLALFATAALLSLTGVAMAISIGLQNPSFENGLDNWTATIVRSGVYDPEPATCPSPNDQRGVCVIEGNDTFTVRDDIYATERQVTVAPLDGNKMLRLGGPFASSGEDQHQDRYRVEQTFIVDPANPVLQLNYNFFTFDYTGFDLLQFKVTLIDKDGDVIYRDDHGSFGSGTDLKNTGWQSAAVDLTGFENQQVHLRIDSGGTEDELYGFWSYIDAGLVPAPPVGDPTVSNPAPDPDGDTVNVSTQSSETGTWIMIPNSQASQYDGPGGQGCVPLTFNVPINGAGGTVSNVKLLFKGDSAGDQSIPMTDADANGVWTGSLQCAATGDLFVEYDLTDEGITQTFVVPIGGITLVDPAGIVYDQAAYDVKRGAGVGHEDALAQTAITGATVRLQRDNGSSFVNVLAGDPGISPNVNPQTTGADGKYAWLTEAGTYRVVVSKGGYLQATSRVVTVPPEVTDLHVGMVRPGAPSTGGETGGTTGGTTGTTTGGDTGASTTQTQGTTPTTTTPAPTGAAPGKPCAGKRGQALKLCNALQNCKKLKGKRRGLCERKARAIAKCNAMKAKTKKQKQRKAACLKKAKAIGAPKKKSSR